MPQLCPHLIFRVDERLTREKRESESIPRLLTFLGEDTLQRPCCCNITYVLVYMALILIKARKISQVSFLLQVEEEERKRILSGFMPLLSLQVKAKFIKFRTPRTIQHNDVHTHSKGKGYMLNKCVRFVGFLETNFVILLLISLTCQKIIQYFSLFYPDLRNPARYMCVSSFVLTRTGNVTRVKVLNVCFALLLA